MSHQDKISANNAFWREMLDQLPVTVFIFRIDQDEQAQLFFVNRHIRFDLGFSPEEYVLGSESEGIISRELNNLVDEIARLSHKDNASDSRTFQLTSRQNVAVNFQFNFRLYQSKSNRTNQIAVSLTSAEDIAEAPAASGAKPARKPDFFVAESDIMKAVLEKTDQAAHQNTHVIFHGEKGTGKKTLGRRILDTIRMTGGGVSVLEANLDGSIPPESKMPELFGPEFDPEAEAFSTTDELLVFLASAHKLSVKQQQNLARLIDTRSEKGNRTRLILTSRYSLEQMAAQDKAHPDLVYRFSFLPIAVPPLRHRKEDIPPLVQKWAAGASKFLNIPEVEFTEAQLFQLQEHEWKDNFTGFYEALRLSVLGAKNGRPELRLSLRKEGSQAALFETESSPLSPSETGEILSFDDMTRYYLRQVLNLTNGKIYGEDGAAELLGLKPTTLQSKLKKLKIR